MDREISLRKHVSQMTRMEAAALAECVHRLPPLTCSAHAARRAREWGISMQDIQGVLREGDVIELHKLGTDIRCVLRLDCGLRSVCITASITTRSIITVWANTQHDHHSTLNMREYVWAINVLSLLPSL